MEKRCFLKAGILTLIFPTLGITYLIGEHYSIKGTAERGSFAQTLATYANSIDMIYAVAMDKIKRNKDNRCFEDWCSSQESLEEGVEK